MLRYATRCFASTRSVDSSIRSHATLSFLNKTAIVTGAGSGIGRIYALELAKRGCNLIVNDIDRTAGEAVIAEINRITATSTNKAIYDNNTVTDDKGKLIVEHALDVYNRVDILINNAGILRDKSFAKMSKTEWDDVLNVHINGSFALSHAVWPHMISNQYGRIINIGSAAGLYGNFGQANYSTAKMGLIGLSNTLSKEGERYNVKVNSVVPIATTKMTETVLPKHILDLLEPKHIAPLVLYLAHETCNVSGKIIEAGGGFFAEVKLVRSEGCYLGSSSKDSAQAGAKEAASVEDVASHMGQICNFEGNNSYPASPADSLRDMLNASTAPPKISKEDSKVGNSNGSSHGVNIPVKSIKIFDQLGLYCITNPISPTIASNKFRVQFNIKNNNSSDDDAMRWLIDTTSSQLILTKVASDTPKTAIITCSDDTFQALASGSLSPEMAYMRGVIKVQGNLKYALQAKVILDITSATLK